MSSISVVPDSAVSCRTEPAAARHTAPPSDHASSPALQLAGGRLDVDVVVPVYNEQRVLAASIARLHSFLSEQLPLSWRIVIADNASTDATPQIAERLSELLPGVRVLRLEQKGRGRALRAAWSQSPARVVCYMDVDLSTDLSGLSPLIAPLLSGHSDVAIGTRLAHGSRVIRGFKREAISRCYNAILRLSLGAQFSDAQCGFKAVRGDLLPSLLDDVQDDAWFFDTELLVCAQRRGLRIHEVPVDWVDDPDSRVAILATAAADLRGVARMQAHSPLLPFLGIGAVSTLAYAALFALLSLVVPTALASGCALALTAMANTAANRRLSFHHRDRERRFRQYLAGVAVFILALVLTDGALVLLRAVDPAPSRWLELCVLPFASIAAPSMRFLALRSWVFAPSRPRQDRRVRLSVATSH